MNVHKISAFVLFGIILAVLIFFAASPKVIRVKSQDVLRELKLAADKYAIELHDIYLTPDNRLQGQVKSVTIIFSREKSFDEQIRSLQKLIKSSTINSNTKQVDFRFTKIVVK